MSQIDEPQTKKDLRAQIVKKRADLGRAIERTEGLKLELLELEQCYHARVGTIEAECELMEFEIFELKKIGDLVQKGETPEEARRIVRERDALNREREEARLYEDMKVHESIKRSSESCDKRSLGKDDATKIKKLWRALAYRFHPDLVQNEDEKRGRERMMKEINHAYVRRDLAALTALEREMGREVSRGDDMEELERELVDLDRALSRVAQRVVAFKRSDWYAMRLLVLSARKEGRDHMETLAARARRVLHAHTKERDNLASALSI